MSVLPHHCAKCDQRWNGYRTAHCAACHKTFSSLSTFDSHRSGSHTDKRGRYCSAPEKVGLVDAGRSYPCWVSPDVNDFFSEETDD